MWERCEALRVAAERFRATQWIAWHGSREGPPLEGVAPLHQALYYALSFEDRLPTTTRGYHRIVTAIDAFRENVSTRETRLIECVKENVGVG